MLKRGWHILKETVEGFIADEAMTRGAAIACYSMFSLAPLLLLMMGMAGLVFGEDAVRQAVGLQLASLIGREGAQAIDSILGEDGLQEQAEAGGIAALVSITFLVITASAVFAELQAALNAIWKAEPRGLSLSYLLRARLLSIGLVAATGFLLLVSLLASAALAALGTWAGTTLPQAAPLLRLANFGVSFLLTALLFAAIYKVLPDRRLRWRDVGMGALCTALLFTLGKSLIGWYIGGSGIAARYGAAGALIVVLLWVFYSTQVFLLGAEFTRAWTRRPGAKRNQPAGIGKAAVRR
ncbi:YihY/virulence factor BrkB family protein [Roseomonas sp. F4]